MYRAFNPWYFGFATSSVSLRKAYVPIRSPSRSNAVSNRRQAASVSADSPSRPRNLAYPSAWPDQSANAASQAASSGNRLDRSQVSAAGISDRAGTRVADMEAPPRMSRHSTAEDGLGRGERVPGPPGPGDRESAAAGRGGHPKRSKTFQGGVCSNSQPSS